MKNPLWAVYSVAILIGISYGMHGPILPVFAKNVIGASYGELGLIGFANFIPYMFIPLFVGILLDRFNNGVLLSIGVIINSTSIFLLSVSQSVPEILGFRALTGIAHAFFWPPSESIISNTSKNNNRVRNISTFTGFFVAGFMIGPLFGTLILTDLDASYRFLFQISSYILATAILFSLFSSKQKFRNHHETISFLAVKQIAKFPIIIVTIIFCISSFGIILTIYPAFLNDKSITDVDIEILFFVFGISRVVTLVFAGKLAKRSSLTIISAIFSITIGMGISFVSESFLEFMLALLIMGFGFSIFLPLALEVVLSKTKKQISGKMIGAFETVFGIGMAAGPITAGLISQFSENNAPYAVFFILGLVVVTLSIVYRKMLEPKKVS